MHPLNSSSWSRAAAIAVLAATATVATALPASAGTISGDNGTSNVTLNGSGETWDLSQASFTQSGFGGGDMPIRMTGSSLTVQGGKVTGTYSPDLSWYDLKGPEKPTHANGAAYFVDDMASGHYVFNNSWAKNVAVDMYRQSSGNLSSATFNRTYSELIRDDIWSFSRRADGSTHYRINDALVEGYTGISWRNTGANADAPFKLTVDGMVMHIKPQTLSSGTCGRWAGGDGNNLGNGSPFKMDSYKGSTGAFTIRNTVIWLEEGNRDSCEHKWPTATWDNVTVVWTGPGSFPGTLPAGVKLTTDKKVYDNARAAWFARGGSSTPAPAPAPDLSKYAPVPGARGTDVACPAGAVPSAGFGDVRGGTHAAAIECVAWWEIAQGRSATEFAPTASVTRAQMARFLARLVVQSGGSLPSNAPNAFSDDEGLPADARQAIDALAAVGIVRGRAAGSFDPSGLVSRAQMASFLAGAYEYRAGTALATGADYFADDDGSVHAQNIGKLARVGISGGTAPAIYNPSRSTSRAEMASFLGRTLDLLVDTRVTRSRV